MGWNWGGPPEGTRAREIWDEEQTEKLEQTKEIILILGHILALALMLFVTITLAF